MDTATMEIDPHEWLQEMALMNEDQREGRKELTSDEFIEGAVGYVFDEAAVAACDIDVKRWIETEVLGGYGVVSKGDLCPHLTAAYCKKYERVLTDVGELIQGLTGDDLISSVYAYFLACSDIFECGTTVFVTGNNKMLELIEEEGSREELHAAVHARTGFPGVRYYMYIDSEGQLKRASLKWDDRARPSHERVFRRLGLSNGSQRVSSL